MILCNVSRLSWEKRPLELIDLFLQVKGKKKFKLIIVGNGPLEEELNEKIRKNGLEKEAERTVKAAEEKILSGRTVVIYTSRQLLAPENMTTEEKLQISVKISNAVTSIIGKLSVKPNFIFA